MGAQTAEAEATHAVGPTELEAVVYPACLGLGAAAVGKRVQQTSTQTSSQSDARAAKGEGELRLSFGLEEGGVAAEEREASELGDGLHEVAARGQEGVVALVVGPGMGEAGLERVPSVSADGGGGILGERGDLAPDARVAKGVLVARLGAPEELGVAAPLDLLVACPALQDGAREAVDLELEVRVGEDRGVKGERVGGAGACSQRAVCVERLGASEQVAQLGVDVGVGLGGAGLGARLDGVVAALVGRDVDVDVGGRRGSIGGVGAVEEDGDGRLEDAEAVQLVGGGADLLQGLLERVRLGAVGAQDGVDDLLEEAAARAVGVQDADRRDGDGERGVVLNLCACQLLLLRRRVPWTGRTSSASRSCDFWCCANRRALSPSCWRFSSAESVLFLSLAKTCSSVSRVPCQSAWPGRTSSSIGDAIRAVAGCSLQLAALARALED